MSPRRRSLAAFAVAALGIAAAIVLFLLGGGESGPAPVPAGLAAIGADLDARVREAAAGLRSRAATLADLPRLAAAVATDAATVQDLTTEELAFRLKPGETIEIAQITRAGQTVPLLRIPKQAPAVARLDAPGSTFGAAAGGGVAVTEVVNITPTVANVIDHGAVGVTWRVDCGPFVDRLAALGAPARIEIDGRPVAATSAAIPEGARTVAVPLAIDPKRAAIVAQAAAGGGGRAPLRIAAIAIAALALVIAGLLARRRSTVAAAAGATPVAPEVAAPISPATATSAPSLGAAAAGAGGKFGRYSLIRRLGTGGMAEVFLARATGEAGFERLVALKIMHPNLAAMPHIVDHFLDEARLASRLMHPNIVQIIDLGRSGDDYFIAMEYIDGYDVDTLLGSGQERGAQIPVGVALAVVRKVCDGLHAAHTATAADGSPLDLVHRDVKAQNVLISRRGEVKIADFGIAKANQRLRATTQLGVVKGTAAYMPPEQRVGQPVDRRADVYGVGAILYELLTGTQINLDLQSLAHLGTEGWPHLPPPSQVRPEVPADLDALVFKALAFDREQRFPTCAAMEEALEEVAARRGLEVKDKAIVHWVEAEMAAIEARAARGGAAS